MNTITRLSVVFAVVGGTLAGGGQLAALGEGTSPSWAMAVWIFGCPLVLAAVILPLVPRCLAWSARRLPGLPASLALAPLYAAGMAAVAGLAILMVRFMP